MNPPLPQRPDRRFAYVRPWPQRPGLALARALQGLSGLAWPGLLSENAHHSRTRALFSRNRFFDFGWLLARFSLQNPTKKASQKTGRRGPFSALGGFGRLGPLLASPWPPFGLLLASLGRPLASLWPLLASPWPPFGLPWSPLAALWPPWRARWPILASLWRSLGASWRLLASFGDRLASLTAKNKTTEGSERKIT